MDRLAKIAGPREPLNSCASFEVLEQLLRGGLPEEQASGLGAHLAGCAHCQILLDQLSERPNLERWVSACRSLGCSAPDEPELGRLLANLSATPPTDTHGPGGPTEPSDMSLRFLAPPQREGDLGMIGPYRVLAEVGRGGMGIVLRAYDEELQRIVALKVLPPYRAEARARARFVREARAAAGLNHENVVPVHAVANPPEGTPYLVMQYVEGPTLRQRIQAEGRLDPQEAAQIGLQVALGLAAAHRAGLVHRDIKPANIILESATGRAKITDFGLVRTTALPGGTTQEGTIPGTPEYMSPEQVREPDRIDARSDIYSLGVTVYEALTATVPFHGVPHMVFQQVLSDEPRPPRRLNDSIPRDLETICLKCLQKESGKRYASANALAEDLRRFLSGEPIRARPVRAWERALKWARRRPAIAALLGLVVFVIAAGFGLVTWQWRRAESAVQALEHQARELLHKNYYQNIALAHQELSADNLGRAEELLDACPREMRHWEWDYLNRRCRVEPVTLPSQGRVYSVAFSPDGQRLASARGDGTVGILDVNTGKEPRTLRGHTDYVFSVAFHPDGKHLASASADRTVKFWDLTTGKEVFSGEGQRGDFIGMAYGVAFSPDGGRLAAGSEKGMVIIWNTTDGQKLLDLPGHEGKTMNVAFSPDGLLLASVSFEGVLRIWDSRTGNPLHMIRAHEKRIAAVAFSPDGQCLATGSLDRTVKIWDVTTGKWMRTLRGLTDWVGGLSFSPDGRRLASTGGDKTVKIWDPESGQEILNLRGHTLQCRCVAFSRDGRRLASASMDGAIRIWDATPLTGSEGEEALTLQHDDEVWSVAFSPDGRRIASGGWDKTVRLWDATRGTRIHTLKEAGDVFQVSFSPPDGKYLASIAITADRKAIIVNVRDATTGEEVRPIRDELPCFCVTFSPDGRFLLNAGAYHTIKVIDARTGEKVGILGRHTDDIWCLRFSPDGKLLASASSDFTVKLWDATRLQQEQVPLLTIPLPLVNGYADRVAFTSDSRRLVTGGEKRTVKIWDARTGELLHSLSGHSGDIYCVAVSPDGRWIASAGEDTTVRLWDARTGEPVQKLRGHTRIVSSLCFSPDSRRLVSGSRDHTVKVWDLTHLKLK
jgi:WD40 repeat protein